ncbi:ADP-ribosyltransferase [Kitasatospora sp. NPDC088783]|uniref:ADP-ribosyltransferase n=1 Tax=Kitasatospora sp. NPDC088783 TaxID=3364077 RepID=UPI003828C815
MRVARRATGTALAADVTAAGAGHPAAGAFDQARQWAERAKAAAAAGDDDQAKVYAMHATACANSARALLKDPQAAQTFPRTADPRQYFRLGRVSPPASDRRTRITPVEMPQPPEHVRSASAIATASGFGGQATYVPREDGSQSVMWGRTGFAGSATVRPADDGGHPTARVVFTSLDRDRYEALARSPWPYRVENGHVVYDGVPADQAEQIVRSAATGRPGTPWKENGLAGGGERQPLGAADAQVLEPESAAWRARLDDEEHRWMRAYTLDAFHDVNTHLHRGRPLDEPAGQQPVTARVMAGHLDAALAKAQPPQRPHRTFRGFRPPQEVLESDGTVEWARRTFTVGGTYRDESYMSTSHCPKIAASFASTRHLREGKWREASHQVVFEVVSSKGAPLASISSYRNTERERLLPRGGNFRVVGVHTDARIGGKATVLVQLVDVDDIPRH